MKNYLIIVGLVVALLVDLFILIPYTAPLINAASSLWAVVGLTGLIGGTILFFVLVAYIVHYIQKEI